MSKQHDDVWTLVGSSNGSHNHGDESMWLATARALRQVEPGSKIITDAWPGWAAPLPEVEVLPFMHDAFLRRGGPPRSRAEAALNLVLNYGAVGRGYTRQVALASGAAARPGLERRWDDAIAGSRGLVFCGAGGITDRFALHAIAGWGAMVALAEKHDVPVAFLGQGIGPVRDLRARASVRRTFEAASLITTRDEHSADEARALSPHSDVESAPDWALLDEPDAADREAARAALERLGVSGPFVTASLHDWTSATVAQRLRASESLASVVRVAAALGCQVVLVPNCTGHKRADDRTFMAAARARLDSRAQENVLVLRERLASPAIRALVGQSCGLFSSRYHPVVFALAEGVPATALCYDDYYVQKQQGALRWYGEEDRVWSVDDPLPPDSWLARGIEDSRSGRARRVRRTEEMAELVRGPFEAWLRKVGSSRV